MKSQSFPFIFSFALCASALRVPIKRSPTQSTTFTLTSGNAGLAVVPGGSKAADSGSGKGDGSLDLRTINDMIYMASVKVAGVDYNIQLDTGSSDLWIKGPTSPLPSTTQMDLAYNLTYGIGWAYGHVAHAPVEFAGIKIPDQAFLDVSSANNPAFQYDAVGILGLGFTSLSTIDSLVNKTGSDKGRSLLYNAFLDNPAEPNFISFALQRSLDKDVNDQGIFTIGEYEPEFEAIKDTKPIATWPVAHPTRWNILLDSFVVGSTRRAVTSVVKDVPAGKAVILMDSGTSYTYCPPEVAEAIYGGFPGAAYNASLRQWILPCNTEIDMALQIDGVMYPIHPLDIIPKFSEKDTTCVGSFVPQNSTLGKSEFDWVVGDNILRSMYSVYDFGDFDSTNKMGDPYVKLLSITNPDEASKAFTDLRGGTPRTGISYNAATGQSSTQATTTDVNLANSLNKLVDYIPIMLGLLGVNALVLLVVLCVGICLLLQRKRGGKRAKKGGMSAMPLTATRSNNSSAPHVYESVGVNGETDDRNFPAPTPSFQGDDSTRRPGVGPRGLPEHKGLPEDYRVSAAGSERTVYDSYTGDRPKSFAH